MAYGCYYSIKFLYCFYHICANICGSITWIQEVNCKFGTICTVKKREKYSWKSVTLSKVVGFSLQLY